MAEYMPLLAVIALLVMFSITFIGPWVGEQLNDASVYLDDDACPPNWALVSETPPKKGPLLDKNSDGLACVKEGIPGQGNTGKGQNVKDNNRGPSS